MRIAHIVSAALDDKTQASIRSLLDQQARMGYETTLLPLEFITNLTATLQSLTVDVIHIHVDVPFELMTNLPPVVLTVYDVQEFFRDNYTSIPALIAGNTTIVATSWQEQQRLKAAGLNAASYVVDDSEIWSLYQMPLQPRQRKLVRLGDLAPRQDVEQVLKFACKSYSKLVMVGDVSRSNNEWFLESVVPKINQTNRKYVVTANEAELFQGACALVVPRGYYPANLYDVWNRPFGLFIVKALASGVPVIQVANGSCRFLRRAVNALIHNEQPALRVYQNLVSPEGCHDYVQPYLSGSRYHAIYRGVLNA